MKILIIRFSSFGDIIQAMSCLEDFHMAYRQVEIHWLVRKDLSEVVAFDSRVKVITFDRAEGISGLFQLAKKLRHEKYDLVYDAHLSMRSRLLKCLMKPLPFIGPRWIVRSKERIKRFLLFKLGINHFPKPYKGMMSYRAPLKKAGIHAAHPVMAHWQLEKLSGYEDHIVLCPSAAWEMKRWPIEHWKNLISILHHKKFVILGGPSDSFCQEIANVAPERTVNLAGKLSLKDSCRVVAHAPLVISADTGLIHIADICGVSGLSLMGPTAFGFCSNPNIKTLGVDLPCRPCTKDGRGKCSQAIYQRCMVEITADLVAHEALALLAITSQGQTP